LSVLRDPQGCKIFRSFLKSVIASEILDFWIAIELFHDIEVIEERVRVALAIYDKYCKASSVHAINMPTKMRETLRSNVGANQFSANMFDQVQDHIYTLLSLDCFRRFQESEIYYTHTGLKEGKFNLKNLKPRCNVLAKKERRTQSQRNLHVYIKCVKDTQKKCNKYYHMYMNHFQFL